MIDHEGEFVVDAARADRVKLAFDYVISRMTELNFACEVLSEQKVDPKWLLGRDDMTGTVDVQIRGNGVLELIDYKDGMAPVDAKDNEQLEQYAYGVLASFEIPVNMPYPFETVRMTIIQPKLAMKGMPAITSHEVSVRELLDNSGAILAQAHAASQPDALLIPGEKQCKYCKAKGNCAALLGNVMQVMDTPNISSLLDKQVNPNELTGEQLKELLEAAPLIRQMLESVEEESLRRLQAGQEVPGYKLVYGRGSRAWSYDDDKMAEKLQKLGIPKGSLFVEKLVSPAQVEKLTWTKRDGTSMKLSDNQLSLLQREYITKSQGKLTVVPLSDPREPANIDASSMFKPVGLPEWLSC